MKESKTFIDDREDDELNDIDVNETEEEIISNINEISDNAKKRHNTEIDKNYKQKQTTILNMFGINNNDTQ